MKSWGSTSNISGRPANLKIYVFSKYHLCYMFFFKSACILEFNERRKSQYYHKMDIVKKSVISVLPTVSTKRSTGRPSLLKGRSVSGWKGLEPYQRQTVPHQGDVSLMD